MKLFLLFSFLISFFSVFAQSSEPVKSAKDSEENSSAKSANSKASESKTTPKPESPAKKELPPLQKEGGFLVLNGVKWQAENITKKSYIVGKEACEKEGMRLPTRYELIDAYFSKYPEFRNPGGYYLSGNRRASNRAHVWFVNFDNGHHNHGSLEREFNVRCVKEEPKSEAKTEPSKTEANPPDAKK